MIDRLKRLRALIEEEEQAGLTKKPAIAREAARVSCDLLAVMARRLVLLEAEVSRLTIEAKAKEIT